MSSFMSSLAIRRKKTPPQLVQSAQETLQAITSAADAAAVAATAATAAAAAVATETTGTTGIPHADGHGDGSASSGLSQPPSTTGENTNPNPAKEQDGELSEPEKKLCSRLNEMKVILYGEAEKDVDEEKAAELSRSIQQESLMATLIDRFLVIPFEARKDTAQVRVCVFDV